MINGRKLFNNSKCWILIPLGWGNARHKYGLGEEWLKSSPADRDLGVLVDSRLSVSQQRANPILGCIKQSITSHSKLSCSIPCWCGLTWSTLCRSGPHHGRRMWRPLNASRRGQCWWKAGRNVLWGTAKDSGFAQLGEKQDEGQPHHSLQLPEEEKWTGRCWALIVTGMHWQDEWKWFKAAQGEVQIGH